LRQEPARTAMPGTKDYGYLSLKLSKIYFGLVVF